MINATSDINSISELNPVINLIEIHKDQQEHYKELITNQYQNLINLGINYIEHIIIDIETFEDMFDYVSNNYLPIPRYDYIVEHPNHIQIFGKFTYEFLCVDLLNWIVPRTCTNNGIMNSLDLRYIQIPALKEMLLRTIITRLNNLKAINNQLSISQSQKDLYQIAFYVDLVDNDISGLVESFIIPMINRYETEIDATILS